MNQSTGRPWLWSIAYAVLSVGLLTPLSILAAPLLLVPVMMLFLTLPLRKAILYGCAASIAAGFIMLPIGVGAVIISAVMLVPAAMMARMYKEQRDARSAVTAGIVSVLAVLLGLILLAYAAGYNFVSMIEEIFRTQITELPKQWQEQVEEVIGTDAFIDMIVDGIPMALIFAAAWIVLPAHLLTVLTARKRGIPLKSFPPMRDWMLPKSLVWYYLGAMLLELLVQDDDSVWLVAAANLIPLLMVVFAVQGIAFLAYVAHIRGKGNALPIAAAVITVLLLPIMLNITSLLGVFDTAFPLRRSISGRGKS